MNKFSLIGIIVFMTFVGSLGGFFFKKATEAPKILEIIKSKFLYIGATLYLLSAVLNIIVLKYMPISVVLPMTAITYIWSMFIAKLILKEKITLFKFIGICAIIVGAIFIANS